MTTQPRHKVRFHAELPVDLYEQLQRAADEEQRSMAAVVRLALEDRFNEKGAA
jgi:hypothetical protein